MKEIIKSKPYFSAYSLKQMNVSPAEAEQKSVNRQFSRVINRAGLFTRLTSYSKTAAINKINIPAAVQPSDKTWFINYE